MKTPWGQVNLSHLLTGIITAAVLGAGGVLWGLVRPEPDRAVEMALIKRDVADLKAQTQRIEEAISRLESGGVRPAGLKR
jgi:hypothetical protein